MTAPFWEESSLAAHHKRQAFDCGDADLNAYLHRYARQNHKAGGAKCFVAASVSDPANVLGYYTLSPASIKFARTPSVATKGLGRYEVPLFRLGRLAVSLNHQRQGLGGALLFRAASRCMRAATEVGGVGLLIDAKDESARDWYAAHGAHELLDAPLSLVLPFATIVDATKA